MDRWKKGLVLLVAVVIAGTAVVATQYAKVSISYSFKVSTRLSSIQLMASDGAISGAGYLLQNSSDVYTISLGTWMKGMNKTFTSAFAIVNGETGTNLRITKIDVTGLASSARVRIWLHENMSTPSDYSMASGITREVGSSTSALAKACAMNQATQLYYDNTTATDFSSNGWVLANANATSEPYTTSILYYHNNNPGVVTAATGVATTWAASNVFVYGAGLTDARGLHCGSLFNYGAKTGFANFVWAEVTLDTAAVAVSYLSVSGQINIYTQSVAG